eukprot:gene8632-11667_t
MSTGRDMKYFVRFVIRSNICGNCSFNTNAVRLLTTTSKASPYSHGLHRSNAEKLINEVAPIKVKRHVAVCDGGGGALGHPVEYIQLDTVSTKPAICKYCGLRYEMDHSHH